MAAKDIMLDSDFVPIIENGDWKVDESGQQHIEHLLLIDKGQLRQYPKLGVGLVRQINGPFLAVQIKRLIQVTLQADNWTIYNIQVVKGSSEENPQLYIDAERTVDNEQL